MPSRGNQKHSTSCLFLHCFLESEREFLNSLFLTYQSTSVLHGIPLSESLLVASSILYSFSLSHTRILLERACASSPLQLSTRQNHQSIDPSMHLSIDPSINQSIDPSIHRSIDQSIHPSINPSIHPSIDPSIN